MIHVLPSHADKPHNPMVNAGAIVISSLIKVKYKGFERWDDIKYRFLTYASVKDDFKLGEKHMYNNLLTISCCYSLHIDNIKPSWRFTTLIIYLTNTQTHTYAHFELWSEINGVPVFKSAEVILWTSYQWSVVTEVWRVSAQKGRVVYESHQLQLPETKVF